MLWEHEVAGSNPVAPAKDFNGVIDPDEPSHVWIRPDYDIQERLDRESGEN